MDRDGVRLWQGQCRLLAVLLKCETVTKVHAEHDNHYCSHARAVCRLVAHVTLTLILGMLVPSAGFTIGAVIYLLCILSYGQLASSLDALHPQIGELG